MGGLQGRRVLILEARMSSELAGLISRHGGQPILAPALREVPDPEAPEVGAFLERLIRGEMDLLVLQTGVGTRALLEGARRRGWEEPTVEALGRVRLACRGPKPTAVLRSLGLKPHVVAPPPHTTAEFIGALREQGWPEPGWRVGLQHYGADNPDLRAYLEGQGARPVEVRPYRWERPEDPEPLREAVRRVVAGEVEAVLFTSKPQVEHFFGTAEEMGLAEALRSALSDRVVTAAVGPVARRTLEARGVRVAVEPSPSQPHMGPLVRALVRHWEEREAAHSAPPGP